MIEFMEDIVKLFTDIEEDQPLPLQHRIVAITLVTTVSSAIVFYLIM